MNQKSLKTTEKLLSNVTDLLCCKGEPIMIRCTMNGPQVIALWLVVFSCGLTFHVVHHAAISKLKSNQSVWLFSNSHNKIMEIFCDVQGLLLCNNYFYFLSINVHCK